MGCDIHMGVEEYIEGRWVLIDDDVYDARCYPLFALLAGVRNDEDWGITPISEPRGIPDDASDRWRRSADYNRDEWSYHSYSWITGEDLRMVDPWATYQRHGDVDTLGNLLAKIPVLGLLYDHRRRCRLVFYFDN